MNSALAVRPDVATPTILHLPPDVHSLDAATEAIELGECYGLTLDPEQKATLHAALGERADGSWAAGEVGDFKGRQAGKNDTTKVRQLAGIELFGHRLILATAHEFPTANEDFLRFVAILEAYDDLRKKVARIRYANGEQGVEWLSGARLKYRARTGGSGRGFAEADLVIYDEAQHLKAEQIAASMPTMLVNPNFQAWFCGSGGLPFSSQAWALRRRAIRGNAGRLAYTENTAQAITVVDDKLVIVNPEPGRMLDEDVLQTHPAYRNGRVSRESMVLMFNTLGPELFGREILNIWDPEDGDAGERIIPADVWANCHAPGSLIVSHDQCSFTISPDRKWASFGIAGRNADGRIHVECIDRRAGETHWVLDKAAEIWAVKRVPVRVHKSGPEASFIPLLRERGVEVVEVSSADVARATGQFIDDALAGNIAHLNDPRLNRSLDGAELKTGADGAALWSQRNSSVEITPLMAVTVALGGVPQEMAFTGSVVVNLNDLLDDDDDDW
jgi:hypothetical protein